MPSGLEPGGLDHRCRLGEASREARRVVRVASECDRLTAFLPPPADYRRGKLSAGVHLQRSAAVSEHPEGVTELRLERVHLEPTGGYRPIPQRVIDMRQHGERVGPF